MTERTRHVLCRRNRQPEQDLPHLPRARRRFAAHRPRRNGGAARRLRLGQIDAAAPSARLPGGGRRRDPGVRPHRAVRRPHRRRHPPRAPRAGLRLPAVQPGQPPAGDHQRAGRPAAPAAVVAPPDHALLAGRAAAGGRGAGRRRHRADGLAARGHPVRRAAAARRAGALPGPGRAHRPRRRADRLARSGIVAQGHGAAGRHERCTRSSSPSAIARAPSPSTGGAWSTTARRRR